MTQNDAFKRNLLGPSLVKALRFFQPPRKHNVPVKKKPRSSVARAYRRAKKYWPQTRRRRYVPFSKHEMTVNALTNWQRNQWAKDGYKANRVTWAAGLVR